MSITKRTLREHAESLRKREYSSRELTAAFLDNIEKKNGEINAFISIDRKTALRAADKADLMLKEENAHPLCGIPYGAKDNICTKDFPTTAASDMIRTFCPPYNAAVIENLTECGAVLLGKTNLDEFAMGCTTETSAFGGVKNPLFPHLTPGGSSGGSAAAVAAELVPFALGSDTGGSIRQPSAFCALSGLCPTYGSVSRFGLIAFASSLDRIGPITKNCSDLYAVLSAISKKDERDMTCKGLSVLFEECMGNIKGLRVGIAEEFFSIGVSDSVKKAVLLCSEMMKGLGAEIVPVTLPSLEYATAAYYIISSAEASSNLARYDSVRFGHRTEKETSSMDELYKESRSEGFGKEVKRRIMLGTRVLSADSYESYYEKALNVRALLKKDYENLFEKCDILLSPATPTPPYKAGEKTDPVTAYAEDFCSVSQSLAGLPSLSLPFGKDEEGLPVSIQLTAPAFFESILLKAGNAISEVIK